MFNVRCRNLAARDYLLLDQLIQASAQFIVETLDIEFEVEPQAAWVPVRRADQGPDAVNDEQHVENMVAQVAKMDMSGAGMEELWISETGTMWVLASVDIEEFSQKINQMTQLNERVREDIVERAREGQGRLWEKTGD